jgi:Lrp/AsnC family leucine-responsive transcriptional regulator
MDEIDLQILTILQEDARVSNAELARQVALAPSAVLERIRKLEARGVIRGYRAELAAQELGHAILAFVFVKADERVAAPRTGSELARIPEVQEVHHIAGEDCYLVKVRAASPEDLGRLLRERFGAVETVRSTRSTIVLETMKESCAVPVPARLQPKPIAVLAPARRQAR